MLYLDGNHTMVKVHYQGETREVALRAHNTVLSALMRCCKEFGLPDEAWLEQTCGLAQQASGKALNGAIVLYDLPCQDEDELWLFEKKENGNSTQKYVNLRKCVFRIYFHSLTYNAFMW